MKKRILSIIFAAFTALNLCSCSNTITQDNTQKSSQNETQQENNQSSQSIENSETSSSDGWQAIKSVKYVYRGAETIADAHDNIVELKELINSVE